MWYELGQALMWVAVGVIVICFLLEPLAYLVGMVKRHILNTQTTVIHNYRQGAEEEKED